MNVGMNPSDLVFSRSEKALYIANSGTGEIIRCRFGEEASFERVYVGVRPMALAIDEASKTLYVADYHLNRIYLLDTVLFSIVGSILLDSLGFEQRDEPPGCCSDLLGDLVLKGRKPVSLALTSDGKSLYCANIGTYDVSHIDIEGRVELNIYDGVVGVRDLIISPDDSLLLLAGTGSDLIDVHDLQVIRAKDGAYVTGIPIGLAVSAVANSGDGSILVAVSEKEGVLKKINPDTWEVIATATFDPGVSDLAVSMDGQYAYLGNSLTGSVYCVSLTTMEEVFEAPDLADPRFLCLLY
jgi:DNA-binding beta-propeller fold protein YncE